MDMSIQSKTVNESTKRSLSLKTQWRIVGKLDGCRLGGEIDKFL